MHRVRFITARKMDIPKKLHQQLAKLMQESETEWQQLPETQLGYFEKQVNTPDRQDRITQWTLGLIEEELVGYGHSEWKIDGSNLNRAYPWVYLKESYRSTSMFRLFFKEILKKLPVQIEYIEPWVVSGSPIDQFISSLDFSPGYNERMSVSRIREQFNPVTIGKEAQRLVNEGGENGYEIHLILDHDFSSLDLVEFIIVFQSISNDMPQEQLTVENLILTEEKLLQFYDYQKAIGCEFVLCVAKHSSSGAIVGLSQTMLNIFNPLVSEQGDTGILHSHRGNSLGKVLKYQILDYLLQQTDVEYWLTGNADSNVHMIRINELLKHEEWYVANEYEIKREDWSKLWS